MIGGNITASIEKKNSNAKNYIGETIEAYEHIGNVCGFLDYLTGEAGVQQYSAKIEDSTHVFICDYDAWINAIGSLHVIPNNIRFIINGEIYEVQLIDNPMMLNQHMEIILKYIGYLTESR